METVSALLLLGPTGSGKTPLGEWLERHGLWGQPCRHFDFGANLRRIAAARVAPPHLAPADLQVIDRVLQTNALLEDEHAHIARNVLLSFITTSAREEGTIIVLNGLPRHVGQAAEVDKVVRVRWVAFLACTAESVRDRIRTDAGGDRGGRRDDVPADIERKLTIFRERTLPLLAHYRAQGAVIEEVPVGVATTPETIARRLEESASLGAALWRAGLQVGTPKRSAPCGKER